MGPGPRQVSAGLDAAAGSVTAQGRSLPAAMAVSLVTAQAQWPQAHPRQRGLTLVSEDPPDCCPAGTPEVTQCLTAGMGDPTGLDIQGVCGGMGLGAKGRRTRGGWLLKITSLIRLHN